MGWLDRVIRRGDRQGLMLGQRRLLNPMTVGSVSVPARAITDAEARMILGLTSPTC